MRLKTILIIVIIFSFGDIKAQNITAGVKILDQGKNGKGTTYGVIEFFIKDKLTKENIPVSIIEFGKIGVVVSDAEGYSKFFVRPGKYDVVVKALGYNEKRIRKLKITSKSNFKIEIALEVKPERMN